MTSDNLSMLIIGITFVVAAIIKAINVLQSGAFKSFFSNIFKRSEPKCKDTEDLRKEFEKCIDSVSNKLKETQIQWEKWKDLCDKNGEQIRSNTKDIERIDKNVEKLGDILRGLSNDVSRAAGEIANWKDYSWQKKD
jgi:peptidoglycan hydrolase CwlO-like protein